MKSYLIPLIFSSVFLFSQKNQQALDKSSVVEVNGKFSNSAKTSVKKKKKKQGTKSLEKQPQATVEETVFRPENKKSSDYAVDGSLLVEKKLDRPRNLSGQTAAIDFLDAHFPQENLFLASLVSKDEEGKLIKGNGAQPTVRANASGDDFSVTFQVELQYQLDWYYNQFLPELIKHFDPIASAKIEKSVSINIEKKDGKEKHFMQPTRTPSFPVPHDLFLQKHNNRLVFSSWSKSLDSKSDSIFLACNLGRDHRGKNQRFAIYEISNLGLQKALDESVGRVIPPLHLEMKDANGSIIRQDRWFPGSLATSKSPTGEPDEGELHPLSQSNSAVLYARYSASYQHPLAVGLIKRSSLGRSPCYVIAPWFTYESGHASRNFFSDAPVLARTLLMSAEDLKALRAIKLSF